MTEQAFKVLLIENDAGDADLVREYLSENIWHSFCVEWAPRLKAGLEKLAQGKIDVVLLDLNLPDSEGLDTFMKVREQAKNIPIVILTGSYKDNELALKAVKKGAQDYLKKGDIDAKSLGRSLRYAVERKRIEETLLNSQLKLIRAAKMESVEKLAAGVAHEVKNPLAIILMGIEYLSENYPNNNHNTMTVLKDIGDAVRRTDRIIKGLLDFSVPKELDLKEGDRNSAIEKSLLLVKRSLIKGRVSVEKKR